MKSQALHKVSPTALLLSRLREMNAQLESAVERSSELHELLKSYSSAVEHPIENKPVLAASNGVDKIT